MKVRKIFYDNIRVSLFKGKLRQSQVNNIEVILNYWEKSKYTDLRWLAYMFATTYHETAHTMRPVEEYGKGRGKAYGKKLKMNRKPYSYPNKIYYGRGYVQLTWYDNYALMGKILNLPLLEQPELALKSEIAVKIMFEGMTYGISFKGDFTGKALEDYFNDKKTDWVNARKIINGLDKAELIAGYAKKFYKALEIADKI